MSLRSPSSFSDCGAVLPAVTSFSAPVAITLVLTTVTVPLTPHDSYALRPRRAACCPPTPPPPSRHVRGDRCLLLPSHHLCRHSALLSHCLLDCPLLRRPSFLSFHFPSRRTLPLLPASHPARLYHRLPLPLPLQSLPSPYPRVFALFLPSHNSRRPVATPPTPSAPFFSPPSRSLGT
ncbi:hypothetical protein EDB86DRAFT_2096634 [Lactarius hatsudake]|nr:hypothetical protein EDB86DRAFT_2096634 [Lactarius hatsudake]